MTRRRARRRRGRAQGELRLHHLSPASVSAAGRPATGTFIALMACVSCPGDVLHFSLSKNAAHIKKSLAANEFESLSCTTWPQCSRARASQAQAAFPLQACWRAPGAWAPGVVVLLRRPADASILLANACILRFAASYGPTIVIQLCSARESVADRRRQALHQPGRAKSRI